MFYVQREHDQKIGLLRNRFGRARCFACFATQRFSALFRVLSLVCHTYVGTLRSREGGNGSVHPRFFDDAAVL